MNTAIPCFISGKNNMIKYKKMLIANRGEIAVRIIRALKELNICSIAVYSTADQHALHTRIADESICIGDAPAADSYLNTYKLLSSASIKGADAIHPGIGFLAENETFPEICRQCGIDFIGPAGKVIGLMGNKNHAKRIVAKYHIPVIPGSCQYLTSLNDCIKAVEKMGLPVVLKAVNGGGGKGIRIIRSTEEIEGSYEMCRKEAAAAFGGCELIAEKYLENTRHVEVQILSDKYGNIIHLGDRECTIQRSNQKLIEEAVCVNIDRDVRERLYCDAVKIAQKIRYVGPGTVEFLILPDGTHYFLEMNTRLQVEHTITELITGVDLLKEQIKIFAGERLSLDQSDIKLTGYAVQCRIIAEDAEKSFRPSYGSITEWNMPGGPGVRVDSGYRCNDTVTPYYDSLLAKVCCTASNKAEAVRKMKMALSEVWIEGIKTNVDFLRYIVEHDDFLMGNYNERFVGRLMDGYMDERGYTTEAFNIRP